MRRLIVSALAVLAIPGAAHALTCADRTPAAITTVAPAALKCQAAIASEGAKFLKAKMKTLAGCRAMGRSGCVCQVIEVGGSRMLAIPESFMQRYAQ